MGYDAYSGLVNALTTVLGSAANARQGAANRRNNIIAASIQRPDVNYNDQPTALAFAAKKDPSEDINGMGLQDLNKSWSDALGGQQMNTYQGQEHGGFRFNDESAPPGSRDSDFHSQSQREDPTPPHVVDEVPKAATVAQSTGGLTTNPNGSKSQDYSAYAGALASLVGTLAQRPQGPSAQMPQEGQMNFSPTALAILARRKNPYGGY
jgi:hypothetical protein